MDGYGHSWQSCDPTNLPPNAIWSTGSTVVGAKTGCEWVCPLATAYAFKGACLPCRSGAVACISGETLENCNNGLKACVPCEGVTPDALKVWTSDAASSFGVCIADCETGVSFSEVMCTVVFSLPCG